MKQITIAGRLVRDAVLRTTQDVDKVAGFSVAVGDRRGQDKSTLYFDCSIWGKRAEALAQYLIKGTSVAVAGDLGTHEHEGRTYLTIRVSELTLQGGGQRDGGYPRDDPAMQAPAGRGPTGGIDLDDDAIPFAPEWRV